MDVRFDKNKQIMASILKCEDKCCTSSYTNTLSHDPTLVTRWWLDPLRAFLMPKDSVICDVCKCNVRPNLRHISLKDVCQLRSHCTLLASCSSTSQDAPPSYHGGVGASQRLSETMKGLRWGFLYRSLLIEKWMCQYQICWLVTLPTSTRQRRACVWAPGWLSYHM